MKHILWFFVFVLSVGCTESDHLLLIDQPLAPKAETYPIQIFADPPPVPYTKIAILEAKESMWWATWNELRDILKGQARALGADALMDLKMGANLSGAIAGGGVLNTPIIGMTEQVKVLTGTAIKFK
jgi:hypothetical protein